MSATPNPNEPRQPAPDEHRPLPHSLDDEQGLLGSMLLAPAEVAPILARLPILAWYGTTGERGLSPHAVIATTCLRMHAEGIL